MKLVCSKGNLLTGLQVVSKAVPNKTTMSILECILIDSTEGEIKLTANDMELGIETIIEGEILEKASSHWMPKFSWKSSGSFLIMISPSPQTAISKLPSPVKKRNSTSSENPEKISLTFPSLREMILL